MRCGATKRSATHCRDRSGQCQWWCCPFSTSWPSPIPALASPSSRARPSWPTLGASSWRWVWGMSSRARPSWPTPGASSSRWVWVILCMARPSWPTPGASSSRWVGVAYAFLAYAFLANAWSFFLKVGVGNVFLAYTWSFFLKVGVVSGPGLSGQCLELLPQGGCG